MKIVLLSGGSGKRLWPLSNEIRSKQFLKLFKSDEKNQLISMVQRIWNQLKKAGLNDSTIIATTSNQSKLIQNQLGNNIPMIIEPSRRDTFPAISLAVAYLYSVQCVDLNEVIAILPVDPFVKDDFFDEVRCLEEILLASHAELALIGVKPTYASQKYGYIVPEYSDNCNDYYYVKQFIEKPPEREASKLIAQGALWNCGVFAFKLKFLIDILEDKGIPTDYYSLLHQYNSLTKNSFDYEIVEKVEKVVVSAYHGEWKDLGTWNTLTEEMDTYQIGMGTIIASENTHLINELDIPVAIIGIPNAIVSVSPNGVLVSDKAQSPRVKEITDDFVRNSNCEEQHWGWCKILDYSCIEDGKKVLTKRIGVVAGKYAGYQIHNFIEEIWTIIKGNGELALNNETRKVKQGDVIKIPQGIKYGIKAFSDIEIVIVRIGFELLDDIFIEQSSPI